MMAKEESLKIPYETSFYHRAIHFLIIILVILTPIAFCPVLIRNFNPVKELIFAIITVTTMTLWSFRVISGDRIRLTSSPLNLPVLIFTIICILSLLWSINRPFTLLELPLFISGPLLYFVVINNIYKQKEYTSILYAILIIGSLMGIYGVLQYQGIDFSFWKRNVGRHNIFGLFGNVNFFAEYLIFPLTLAVPLFLDCKNKIKKISLFIGILAMGSALLFTITRGSYLAFVISFVFMLSLFVLVRGKSVLRKNKKIILLCLTFVIVFLSLIFVPNPLNKPDAVFYKIKERIALDEFAQNYSVVRRIATWKFTAMMIKDKPILGSGLGTFKYNTLKYQALFFSQGDNRKHYPGGFADKAHNEYLQIWAELGLFGLAVFIWLVISYFCQGLRFLKRIKDEKKQAIIIGLMGAVIAVLVDGTFGFPLHLPATIALFWLALALLVVMIRNEDGLKKRNDEKDLNKTKEKTLNQKAFYLKSILYLIVFGLSLATILLLIRPFISQIYQFYGVVNIKRGNQEEGIKNYQKALKWNPYFGMIYYDLGMILHQRGLYGQAVENYEKAEKFMDYPNLPQNLAYTYLKRGQLDKAIDKFKQAISYQKQKRAMVPLYIDLGKTYLRLRNFKLAETAFEDALKINSEEVGAHYGLAMVYLSQNLKEKGLEELKEVMRLAPESPEAKYAENTINQLTNDQKEEKREELIKKEDE